MKSTLRTFLLFTFLSFLFVSGCKESSNTLIDSPGTNQTLTKAVLPMTQSMATEGFESGSKTAYAAADVTLGTGIWNMSDALIGTSTSDVKNGTASARVRNSGTIMMKFDLTKGASTVTIKHAMYGSDASTTWQLWYSINRGSTWTQTGSTITTSATTLQTASFTVNVSGTIRFEIIKTDGTSNRTNIDDIAVSDYVINNPVPAATSLSPTSAAAGSASFTLTVNGSSFISSSVVKWNGTSLTTTYVSATKVTAIVPAANIASAGTATVTVFNPTPGGGTSSGLTFTITSSNNPVPVALSMSPSSAAKGSSSFTLALTGSSFISSSVVKWNSTSLTTTYVSATQLNATVPAANVATAGSATVTVFTPTPGGGTSSGLTFTIYTVSSNVNLTMGNPSGATTDVNYPHNYLLDKPQFCVSYDRDKGIPNWVSWQVNSTWCNGPAVRKDNFIPDNQLPSSWYHVVTGDYTGSNFSRGHMCPSADRVETQGCNDSVFVMTNMIPQNQNNNGGPWEALETYERTLANSGNVLYIISGGYGSGGTDLNGIVQTTIAGGKVTVPAKTWKVIMVLPAGTNDVSRVTTSTRCIAVIMNNDNGPFNSWGTYRVSVDYIESLTGYDFFSNVSPSIQAVIESVVDSGPTQ
jgi:DNA/RNA endonuclease G (NUC1)